MKPSVVIKIDKFNTFMKGISENYTVKVGIMGGSKPGERGVAANASIGVVHEFGKKTSPRVPKRSFLRMPLLSKSEEIINDTGKNSLQLLADGNFKQVFVNLGVACETQIGYAFATGGFGTWKKLKPSTIKKKGHAKILWETEQLQASIISKVETK